MNFWHVFTTKLSDRSLSSSSPENSYNKIEEKVRSQYDFDTF